MKAEASKRLQPQLINDVTLADLLAMSLPWVRQERFKRRHGLPHTLDLEPVYMGRSPRYRISDVLRWLGVNDTRCAA